MVSHKRELCIVHSDIDANLYQNRYEHRVHILTIMALNSTFNFRNVIPTYMA